MLKQCAVKFGCNILPARGSLIKGLKAIVKLKKNIFRRLKNSTTTGFILGLEAHEEDFFSGRLKEAARGTSLKVTDKFIQHGNTSCLRHSVAVAYYSYWLSRKLRLKCDFGSLIRGALLHDYFLYDWHDGCPGAGPHGVTHPRAAHENAVRDCGPVTEVESDIILKHMFPLTLTPPRYKESAIVCLVDKICSLNETLLSDRYENLRPHFNDLLSAEKDVEITGGS